MNKFALSVVVLMTFVCGSFALAQTADDDIRITDMKAKKIAGVKRLYLETFTMNFAVKQSASATSSQLRGNSQAAVKVAATLGVSRDTMQNITNRAFEIFKEKAKASGFEYVDNSEFQTLPIFEGDNQKAHAPVALPDDLDQVEVACATATPEGFTTLIAPMAPMKTLKAFKGNDILAVKSNLNVSFVDFDAKSSKIGIAARVNWKEDIALSQGIACPMKIFGGVASTNVATSLYTQYGYGFHLGLKQDFSAGNELGEWIEVTGGENEFALFGYGSSVKWSGNMLKIDEAQYTEAVLAQVNRFWDYYFQELVRLNSEE